MRRTGFVAFFVAAAMTLSACGGGGHGGSSSGPGASTPAPATGPGTTTPPSATDPEPEVPQVTHINMVERNVVQFDEEQVFDNRSVWPLPAPVQPGNTLVLAFTPTLGESTILSVVDDQGNTYTHDLSTQEVHFFHLSNITNGPVKIIATADMPLDTRLYAWEISGLGPHPVLVDSVLSHFTDADASSASLSTTGPAFLAAVVHVSPSRVPRATGGAKLHRLLQLSSGVPYSGAVSEHAAHRIDEEGGTRVIGTNWPNQAPTSGYIGAVAFQPSP